jgi:hypothetical protein
MLNKNIIYSDFILKKKSFVLNDEFIKNENDAITAEIEKNSTKDEIKIRIKDLSNLF